MSIAIAIIATVLVVWVVLAMFLAAYDPWPNAFSRSLGESAFLLFALAVVIGVVFGLYYLWEWAL